MEPDVCPIPACGKPLDEGNNAPGSRYRFRICEDGHLLVEPSAVLREVAIKEQPE